MHELDLVLGRPFFPAGQAQVHDLAGIGQIIDVFTHVAEVRQVAVAGRHITGYRGWVAADGRGQAFQIVEKTGWRQHPLLRQFEYPLEYAGQVGQLVTRQQHPHIDGGFLRITEILVHHPGIEYLRQGFADFLLQIAHAQRIAELRHPALQLGQLAAFGWRRGLLLLRNRQRQYAVDSGLNLLRDLVGQHLQHLAELIHLTQFDTIVEVTDAGVIRQFFIDILGPRVIRGR